MEIQNDYYPCGMICVMSDWQPVIEIHFRSKTLGITHHWTTTYNIALLSPLSNSPCANPWFLDRPSQRVISARD